MVSIDARTVAVLKDHCCRPEAELAHDREKEWSNTGQVSLAGG